MNKFRMVWACALMGVAGSVALADDDSAYDRDSMSSYDQYDQRGIYSGREHGTNRSDSDRYDDDRYDSDRYDSNRDRYSSGRTWGDDRSMSRGQSDWNQGRYSSGYGQSQFDQGSGRSQYGYMGNDDYDDWNMRNEGYGRSGYGQRGSDRGYASDWNQGRYGQGDWRSQGDWRDDSFGQGMSQRRGMGSQTVAVLGKLTDQNASLQGINPNNKVLELRTQSGSTILVDLGSGQQTQDLNLSQNQSIFARGHLTTVRGQRVLRAQEIAKISQRITLNRNQQQDRFSQGQQSGSDIYGYNNSQRQGQSGQSGQSGEFRSGSSDRQNWSNQSRSGQSGSQDWYSGQSDQDWNSGSSSGSMSGSSSGSSSGQSSSSDQSSGSSRSNSADQSDSSNRNR